MIKNGLDVARFNFSHSSHEEHGERLKLLTAIAKEEGTSVAAFADLCGPKVRVCALEGELVLQEGQEVVINGVRQGLVSIQVSYEFLHEELTSGSVIMVDDGKLELVVLSADATGVIASVTRGGTLINEKGVNIPGAFKKLPILTHKDKEDLRYIMNSSFDAIAVSFVRDAQDLKEVKEYMLSLANRQLPIIAKIETRAALGNLEGILAEADVVMVARGDLGVEVGLAHVPLYQKEICHYARQKNVPVIVATQMLQSMVHATSPTRAEVSDVVTALLDGASYVMLSDETTVGEYPALTIKTCKTLLNEYDSE